MVSEIMKVEDKMKENHEAMDVRVSEVVTQTDARVSEVEAKLSAQVAGVASEMGELKAMMAQLLAEGRR